MARGPQAGKSTEESISQYPSSLLKHQCFNIENIHNQEYEEDCSNILPYFDKDNSESSKIDYAAVIIPFYRGENWLIWNTVLVVMN